MRIVDVNGRSKAIKMLLESASTYATTLALILFDEYGKEWLEWHPTTLYMELKEDFGAETKRTNIDKMMAVNTLLTTDGFYNSLPTFVDICNVFADNEFDPETFDPATTEEMAWALTEIFLLDPPDDVTTAFSEEIKAYIRKAAQDDGLINLPDVLRLAQTPDMKDPAAEFADDPDMYAGIWDLQKSKMEAIDATIRENVKVMTLQIEALPLLDGDASTFVSKVRKAGLLE